MKNFIVKKEGLQEFIDKYCIDKKKPEPGMRRSIFTKEIFLNKLFLPADTLFFEVDEKTENGTAKMVFKYVVDEHDDVCLKAAYDSCEIKDFELFY